MDVHIRMEQKIKVIFFFVSKRKLFSIVIFLYIILYNIIYY